MHYQPSIPQTYPYHHQQPMDVHSNQFEVTVVGCNKLKDTEWIARQDPYVCLEYGNTRNRTRVCTDGGKTPTFQEKFAYSIIEGLKELNIIVWNHNTISRDDFIGSGKVHLAKVLSQGYDDSSWPLQTKTGRHAGEVRLIMHYSGAIANSHVPSVPSYVTASAPQMSMYYSGTNANNHMPSVPSYATAGAPQMSMYCTPTPPSCMFYPPATTEAYPMPSTYPPQPAPYPPQSYTPYSVYPPPPYGDSYSHGSQYTGWDHHHRSASPTIGN